MDELDLIPADYRRWLAQQRSMKTAGIAIGCLLVAIVAAGSLISRGVERAEVRVAELQSQNAISQQQRDQLERLKSQHAEYERQWSLLRGLRAGAAAEDIFTIVDKALKGKDLWFVSWRFRRAGVIVEAGERGVETGYFIVIPAGEQTDGDDRWQVETHMAINGQARDHQALSTFVRALFEQSEIKDVSVQKTSQINYAGGRAVNFDMTVVLNSALKET